MNRTSFVAVVILAVIAVVVLLSSTFTVNQWQQALVLQFGQPRQAISEPGLHFKMPFIQNVIYFEKRLLNLDLALVPVLIAAMLAGTPAVSFLGGVGAALTLRNRRGGLLVAVLMLPLYVPTLIFGIGAVSAVAYDTGAATSTFLILAAISLAAMVLGPVASAAALRAQMS